tara:strand:- start:1467 stop:2252 length:786 start_codon:yes stop_codon:yes gene_type:complete
MHYCALVLCLFGALSTYTWANDAPRSETPQPIIYTTEPWLDPWVERIGGGSIEIIHPKEPPSNNTIPLIESGLKTTTVSTFSHRIVLTDGIPLLYRGQGLYPIQPTYCKLTQGEKKPCCCKKNKRQARYAAIHKDSNTAQTIHEGAWMDVSITMSMVVTLSEALCEAFPKLAPSIQANTQAYLAELEILDNWLFEQADNLIATNITAPNDDWLYFTRRYGLQAPEGRTAQAPLAPPQGDYKEHMQKLINNLNPAQNKASET